MFKVIWSKAQGAWVAVSEIVRAHGKEQSLTRITRKFAIAAVMSGGAAIAAPPAANQLPTGGQIAAGVASMMTNGNKLTVTQTSNRAAINWNTFDIGSQATVNFVQPSANSVALNRVNSPNPSQIFGNLNANGQVYLLNSAGVYFAPGAQVNVGGIVATTHSMSDAAFMAGSTTFDRNGSTGKVINEGTIQTSLNGYIAMLAPEVRNTGLLVAQAGTVVMAGGEAISLNFGASSKLESITVTASQIDVLVENRYAIKAPNGLVILSARAMNQLAASVINSGTIEAKGVSQKGGRIVLEGSSVNNTGTLDVSSDVAEAGTITINGKTVSISGRVIATSPVQGGTIKAQATQTLNVNANIDVSSSQRGGQVQMSGAQVAIANANINADGDTQGGDVQVQATNAQSTNPFSDPFNPPSLPLTMAITGYTGISSRSRRGQGGNVTILGDSITLDDNTAINVSGATGGGNVLVGGDWQGSNGTYQATTTYMGQNVTIDASATDIGTGGKVVIWSDVTNAISTTTVYGSIYARGGVNGGDGGQVETSGHNLDTSGIAVNAGATYGKGGLWLLDPNDYSVNSVAAANIVSSLANNNIVISTATTNASQGSTSSTTGNIYISSDIVANTNYNLTFQASGVIAVNGGVKIWLNSNSNVTYSNSSGTGSLFMGGANVSSITSSNWNTGTDYYANASSNSIYSGIALGLGSQSSMGGTNSAVDIRAGGNLTFAGMNQQGGGYAGITLYSGSTISGANVSFYGNSTVGVGQQLSWGSSVAINLTASNTLLIAGQSSCGSAAQNFGSFINGAVLNAPTVQLIGRNTSSNASSNYSYYSGISLGWLGQASQTTNINTNMLKITSDSIALGNSPVNVSALNAGTFGFNISSYTASSAVTFAYDGASAVANSTAMPTGGTNSAFNSKLILPTGSYSSITYNSFADLTVASALTTTGAISITGGNITLNASLTTTTNGSGILAKANGNITTANATSFQTNNGSLVFWSDANGGSSGYVAFGNNVTLNTANGTTSQSSGGGDIIIGGGSNSGNTPTGFAYSTSTGMSGVQFGTTANTSSLLANGNSTALIYSGGGNVSILGCSTAAFGVVGYGDLQIRSGQGAVNISGNSSSTYGLEFGNNVATGTTGLYIESSKTSGTAISIAGVTTAANNYGVVFDFTDNKYLEATGGGGISVNGTGTGTLYGIFSPAVNYLSSSGPIALNGGTKGIYFNSVANTIGQLAGTNVTSSTANVTITGDVINLGIGTTVNTSGNVSILSNATSFASALSTANLALSTSVASLTVGNTGNTQGITIASAANIAGPISIYGGNITLNANLTTTTNGSGILAMATGAITTADNLGFNTNNGSLTLWSNSNGVATTATAIQVGNNTIFNTSGTANQLTGGGNIILGGGSASSNGAPTGAALSSGGYGVAIGAWGAAATNVSFVSGGGNVSIIGCTSAASDEGLAWTRDGSINAGLGSITLSGTATGASSSHGAEITAFGGNVNLTAGGGVTLFGSSATTIVSGYYGIIYRGNVVVNGSGAINICGTVSTTSTGNSVYLYGSLLASSGNISITGIGPTLQFDASGVSIGAKAGSAIPSSTSNITITANSFAGNPILNSTGLALVQSYSNNFTSAFSTSGWTFSNNLSGLTIGKSTETQNITIANAVNIAGPISIYGGNISLNANLTSTGSTSEILVKGVGTITGAANLLYQTNNGSLVFWSNSNGGTAGGIAFGNTSTFNTANGNTSQTTGGGALTMGGGTSTGTDAAGNTIPTGAALSATTTGISLGTNTNGLTLTTIYTGGGNISINGTSTYSGGVDGVVFAQDSKVNAGSGSINITGNAASGAWCGIELGAGSLGSGLGFNITAGGGISLTGIGGGSATGIQARFAPGGSINATGTGAITINGSAGANITGVNFNMNSTGTPGNLTIDSNSGAINLIGYASGSNGTGINLASNNYIVSSSGNITLNGSSSANSLSLQANFGIGSVVSSSSSNVTLIGDKINFAAPTTVNSSGNFGIYSNSTSFASAFFTTNLTLGTSLASLTIGKTTNSQNVTISNAVNVAGPISVYGNNIFVMANITENTSGVGSLLLQAQNTISVGYDAVNTNVNVTISNGSAGGKLNAIFWADSDGSGTGSVWLNNGLRTSGFNTINTNGGGVWIGGGNVTAATTWTPYAGATAVNVGAASAKQDDLFGWFGIGIFNTTINTSGGNVYMSGNANAGGILNNPRFGTYFANGSIQAAGGNITINGIGGASACGTNYGTFIGSTNISTTSSGYITVNGTGGTVGVSDYGVWITSANISTANSTLSINGIGGNSAGIQNIGVLLDANTTLSSTLGDINITGVGGTNASSGSQNAGIWLNASTIKSTVGNITLTGTKGVGTTSYGIQSAPNSSLAITIGQYGQTGNIALISNDIFLDGTGTTPNTYKLISNGSVTIAPLGTSFTTALDTTGLTFCATANSSLSSVTLGSATNTANITVGSLINVSGPIAVTGGNITLNAGLTTTNTTTGNINLTGNVSGAGNIAVASGLALNVNQSGASTYSGCISGTTAQLIKAGSGTLTLSGANTYSGATNVTAGTLIVSGSLSDSTAVNVSSGAAYNVSATDTIGSFAGVGTINLGSGYVLTAFGDNSSSVFAGTISGAGGLTKAGTGTLTLNGTDTYTGGTTVNNGTLQVGNAGTTGSLGGGNIAVNNANLTFNYSAGSYTVGNATNTAYVTLNNATVNVSSGNVTLAGYSSTSGTAVGASTMNTAVNLSGVNNLSAASGASLNLLGVSTGAYAHSIALQANSTLNTNGAVTLTANASSGVGSHWAMGIYANTAINAASGSALQINVTQTANDWGIIQYGAAPTTATSGNVTFNISALAGDLTSVNTGGAVISPSFTSINGTLTFNFAGVTATTGALYLNGSSAMNATSTGNIIINGSGSSNIYLAAGSGFATGAGNLTINAPINTNGNTLTLSGAAGNVTLNGIVSGAGNLTQNTSGTTTLTNANTYTGTTNVSAGTLVVNGSLADATIVNISSGATYNVSSTDTIGSFVGAGTINLGTGYSLTANAINSATTYSGVIAGAGNLVVNGSSALTLTGASTYTGNTTISAGTLQIGNGTTVGSIANTSAIIDNGSLAYNHSDALTQSLAITGTGNLTLVTGNLTLTNANNSYSGITTITAGNLILGGAGTLGNGSYAGNISNAGTLIYNSTAGQILSGNMSGTGNLTQNSSSTLILSGANSYSGNTTISAGTLQIGNNGSTGAIGSGNITNNANLTYLFSNTSAVLLPNTKYSGSGNLSVTAGAIGFTGNLNLGSGAFVYNATAPSSGYGSFASLTNATSIVTAGSANLTGFMGGSNASVNSYTLTIDTSAANGSINLNGIVNGGTGTAPFNIESVLYKAGAGTINISGSNIYNAWDQSGSVEFRAAQIIGTGTFSNVDTGHQTSLLKFNTSANSTFSGAFSSIAGSSYNLNVSSIGSGNLTMVGLLSGGVNLIQNGTGTLIIPVADTYTGSTSVVAGTLQIGNGTTNGSINVSSNVNISSGAILAFNHTDALTIGNAISGAGGLTISQANAVNITGAATYTGNTSVAGGALTFTNTNAPSTSGFTGTGTILIQPNGTSFGSAQTTNYSVANGFTSFTIGGATNTANLTIGSASNISISGPISLYAGNITLNSNLTSTAVGSKILIEALGAISTGADNLTFQTNNGTMVFWSNANSTSGGGISMLNAGLTFNTANGASNQATGGGDLIFGGGATVDANGNPTGAAVSAGNTIAFNPGSAGNTFTKMYTGGGNISINAKSTGGYGVMFDRATIINAGNGSFNVQTNATSIGIEMNAYGGATNGTSITAQGIAINASSSGSAAVYAANNGIEFNSTGTGAISITGTSTPAAGNYGIHLGSDAVNMFNLTSASGNITLNGSGGSSAIEYYLGNIKSTSGGSISITANSPSWAGFYQPYTVNYSTTTGNITFNVTGSLGYDAIHLGGGNFTTTTGNISLVGNQTGNQSGINFVTNQTNFSTAGGSVTLNGTAVSNIGLDFGVAVNVTTSGAGAINLYGTSSSNDGIYSGAAVNLNASQGTGGINVCATSTSYLGAYINSNFNLISGAGNINLTGTTAAANQGIYIYSGNIATNSGNINLTGTSGSSYGFDWVRDSGIGAITSTSGNITINGNTGAATYGTYLAGTNISSAGVISINAVGGIYSGSNITSSGAGNALILKATGQIFSANVSRTYQTNNGSLVFWSNSNGGVAGGVVLQDGNIVLNSANGNTSQLAGGGAIIVGGGTATTTDAAGFVLPTGAVNKNSDWAIEFGGSTTNVAMYSGGGNINIQGNTSGGNAVLFGRNATINAGNGSINIAGCGTAAGVYLNTWDGGAYNIIAKGDISITGSTTGSGTNDYDYSGIRSYFDNTSQGGTIRSTGGNVTLTGSGVQAGLYIYNNNNIISDVGNVTLTGTASSGNRGIVMYGNVLAGGSNINITTTNNNYIFLAGTVGQLAGSNVTSTNANITISGSQLFNGQAPTINTGTGNVTLRANTWSLGTTTIGTNGSISILPLSDTASSGQDVYTSWFNLNPTINGTTYTPNKLTIGNPYNTYAVDWNSNVTVKGGISLYGGEVNITAAMISNGTGDIWVQGNNASDNYAIYMSGAGSIQKTGGVASNITLRSNSRLMANGNISATGTSANVIEWSDYGNTNYGGNSGTGNITTNGGMVWIGGSSTTNGSLIWNGLTVGDGGSAGSASANNNAIDFNGNITTSGGDVLVWSGNSSVTGGSILSVTSGTKIDAGSGNITLITPKIGSNALTVNTSGTLTWAPNAGADWSTTGTWSGTTTTGTFSTTSGTTFGNLSIANVSSLANLVLGQYSGMTYANSTAYVASTTANLAYNSSMTGFAGNLSLFAPNIAINSALSSVSVNRVLLSGNATQTAGFIAANLLVQNGNINLSSASNNVTTFAASNVTNVTYVDANGLTIGTIGSVNGVNASGLVNISTVAGDLALTQTVNTTSTNGTSAIILNAGSGTANGTATGGNITLSGSGNVSSGSGGRITLFTGSIAGSTGITTLIGSGSGRFRYGSNATANGYNATSAALSTGTYAIYREAPTLTISASNATIVYGNSTSSAMSSTTQNGDTYTQIFGAANVPTLAIAGAGYSTAGYLKAGNYTAGITGITTNSLGYGTITYSNGTIQVTKANLTVSGTQVTDAVYSNSTVATFTNNGALGGVLSNATSSVSDVVSLSASGNFSSKNVGTNLSVTLNSSISGADASNYNVVQQTGVTGNITPKTITISDVQVYSGSNSLTNVTIATGVAGETLTYTAATANSGHVADNSTNYITAITLGNQSGATLSAGGLVSNYQLPSLTVRGASNTVNITAANLTLATTGNVTKTYDGTANATVGLANLSITGLVSGDSLTLSNLTTAKHVRRQ